MSSPDALRAALVDQIMTWQPLSDPVAAAMRRVERHLFVPDVSLAEAYSDDSVVTRRDAAGVATSSASAPWLVGAMLDQLQVGPGMRVLEVGAGTGYNAALLAELVGPTGHVTTVELAPDVADDARAALGRAAVANVEVVCGDGSDGHPGNAPYDRIIVTAGAWEVPEAWAEQLAPSGVLVVPLRMRGVSRAVALTRDVEGVWRSNSVVVCGFMPVRGPGAVAEHNLQLADDIVARFDDDQQAPLRALQQAAAGPGEIVWTGIQIETSLDLLDFYLADLDGFCRILAPESIADRGMAEPLNGWGSMGVATPAALGYLTKRTSPVNPYLYELGVCAYGPGAAETVTRLADRVRAWDRVRASTSGVRIDIHPLDTEATTEALLTADKQHSRVVVTPDADLV